MTQTRLSQLIPRSNLARKCIAVLVCYLDDSGKDPQNRITTVAGFVAPEKSWEAFELTVEPVFQAYGISVLHAMDLHHRRGTFKGWTTAKRRAFVAEITQKMAPFIPLGLSMSALKSAYAVEKMRRGRQRTATPYSFCINVIWGWIFTDIRVGEQANRDGVALIVEHGHQNNAEAKIIFEETQAFFAHEISLHSLTFVRKTHSRAIQMADLLAFYARRHGGAQEKAPPQEISKVRPEPMLDIIQRAVPIRATVATSFGTDAQDTVTRNFIINPA